MENIDQAVEFAITTAPDTNGATLAEEALAASAGALTPADAARAARRAAANVEKYWSVPLRRDGREMSKAEKDVAFDLEFLDQLRLLRS